MRHAESRRRRRLAIGVASVVVAVVATAIAGSATAALTAPPKAEGEPVVSGTARVGEVLRTTRGSWVSTTSITYAYRWYRCQGRGAADASDCRAHRKCTERHLQAARRRRWILDPFADRRDQRRRLDEVDVESRSAQSSRPVPRMSRLRRSPELPSREADSPRAAASGSATLRSPMPSGGFGATRAPTTATRSTERRTTRTCFCRRTSAGRSACASRRGTTPARSPRSPTRQPPSSRTFLRPVGSRSAPCSQAVTSSSSRRSCSRPAR